MGDLWRSSSDAKSGFYDKRESRAERKDNKKWNSTIEHNIIYSFFDSIDRSLYPSFGHSSYINLRASERTLCPTPSHICFICRASSMHNCSREMPLLPVSVINVHNHQSYADTTSSSIRLPRLVSLYSVRPFDLWVKLIGSRSLLLWAKVRLTL